MRTIPRTTLDLNGALFVHDAIVEELLQHTFQNATADTSATYADAHVDTYIQESIALDGTMSDTPVVHAAARGDAFKEKANSFFSIYLNTEEYLQNKADALNASEGTGWTADKVAQAFADAQLTAAQHFIKYGAWEQAADGGLGINPSSYFDLDTYYEEKIEQCKAVEGITYTKEELARVMQNAGLDPIDHYARYGYQEGLVPRNEDRNAQTFDTWGHIPLSGDTKIDSLITEDLNWNAAIKDNTISVRFVKNEQEIRNAFMWDGINKYLEGFTPYSQEQVDDARTTLTYISGVTGITFKEADAGTAANFYLYASDLSGLKASGLTGYIVFDRQLFVILDRSLTDIGQGEGRQTLVHELGHALGLKHPFESVDTNSTRLDKAEDTLSNTIMSYTHPNADHWFYTTNSNEYFQSYDIMALGYLYGSDGINGNEGLVFAI